MPASPTDPIMLDLSASAITPNSLPTPGIASFTSLVPAS
ncbi:Uncharacterised protein [Mycobacteroides abscessus subsp. abscessus]|nr:Uncharacterised protein [Mycobacteroides abscessus subsp. abscessus]